MTKSKSRSQRPSTSPGQAEPPRRKTLRLGTPAGAPEAVAERPAAAPRGAPEVARRVRDLAERIGHALASGGDGPEALARLERAWAALTLADVPERTIHRVAHLVERAHQALHDGSPRPTAQALASAAHVLYNGLPGSVHREVDFAQVLRLMRELERDADGAEATVRTTAELLGWTRRAQALAAQAIRRAAASALDGS